MCDRDDITQWFDELAQGDASAAERLWRSYWTKLVDLARRNLRSSRRRVADEEDIALSAFNSFCRSAAAGRFPDLNDRDDLWKLLVTLTVRKASAQLRREYAMKRGDRNVRGESVFVAGDGSSVSGGIGQALSDEPTPEIAALAAEECELLLSQLDENHREAAVMKLEGYSVVEIADRLNCVPVTVRRRLRHIREIWSETGE